MIAARSHILAFDFGATSSKGLLTTFDGKDIAEVEAQGFNLRSADTESFFSLFNELIRVLSTKANQSVESPVAIAMGFAGGGDPKTLEQLREAIKQQWSGTLVLPAHDAFIAQYGAFEGGPGIILIAGTGSIAYGRTPDNRETRAGGWGWMLGDEGGGWWIGREALRAVLLAQEGGPDTKLAAPVLEHLSLKDAYEILATVYRAGFKREIIAELAPVVIRIAKNGDKTAREILHRAGLELGQMAIRAARELNIEPSDLHVALLGGVVEHSGETLYRGIDQALDDYKSEAVEPDSPRSDDQPSEATSRAGNDSPFETAQFPPRDLTIKLPPGPCRVQPRLDALHGAAQWARDRLIRRQFA